jgi:putative ABC transport system permease protein
MHIPVFWTLTENGESTWAVGARVSPAVLHAFGVSPIVGRLFTDEEEQESRDAVLLLSHRMWRQRFGGGADVLGRTVTLEGRGYAVVGVMPADFWFPDAGAGYWVPFVAPRSGPRAQQRLPLTVRVRDDVAVESAQAELISLLPQVRDEAAAIERPPLVSLLPLCDLVTAPIRPALLVLFWAVACVLLIACINVSNLLLARSQTRQREYAMRVALGATRGRLVQQALAESLLLAFAGGAAGIVLAYGGLALLRMLAGGVARRDVGPSTVLPRLEEIAIQGEVWLYAAGLCLLTAIVFGLAPALRASGARPAELLRDSRDGTVAARIRSGFGGHGALIVAEVALATVLLVGGGLLIRSFVNLASVDLGFNPTNVLTLQLALPPGRSEAELKALGERVAERLRALDGVEAVGYTESLPMIPSGRMVPIRFTPEMPRSTRPPGFGPDRPDLADGRAVSRGYVRAMGMRLIEGRSFAAAEQAGTARPLLINQRLARSGLLGPQPIGRQVYALGREPWEVVGIFEDVRQFDVSRAPEQQVLMDIGEIADPLNRSFGLYFAIRVNGSLTPLASGVRDVVRQIDTRAMVENVGPMRELVTHSTARSRFYAVLMGVFAALAVLLAAVGIYGVLNYAVVQRTREIGIRMALGAPLLATIGGVARQAAILVATGLTIGAAASVAASRWLEGLVFGLTPLDRGTFVLALALFASIAAIAVVLPGHRAARIDPVRALRCE